tara:strand:- start:1918 stop:2265 length:348 start_codon:yes stop_codon:yes gene_type:complete
MFTRQYIHNFIESGEEKTVIDDWANLNFSIDAKDIAIDNKVSLVYSFRFSTEVIYSPNESGSFEDSKRRAVDGMFYYMNGELIKSLSLLRHKMLSKSKSESLEYLESIIDTLESR